MVFDKNLRTPAADQQPQALGGYRVLELADTKGAYCGKLLADLGADVIKIEDPKGDPTRRIPPFAGGMPHHEKSLYFLYRNANKRGVTLDLETPDGRAIFKRLVKIADVLLETRPPGYMSHLGLGYQVLKEVNAGLVMADITDFGQTGPHKDWKGSDIVSYALCGQMITDGFRDKPPCKLPGNPTCDAASLVAAAEILVALYCRGLTGEGQSVETSVMEAAQVGISAWVVPTYTYLLTGPTAVHYQRRSGAANYPVLPCKDGWVRIVAIAPRQWDALRRVLGNPETLASPEWYKIQYRTANYDRLLSLAEEYSKRFTMDEFCEVAHKEGIPAAPVCSVPDFVNGSQSMARKSFVEFNHPVAGKALYPWVPYRLSETPCRVKRPAPRLGEHNEEVYCEEMGLSRNDLAALRQAGVI